MNDWIEIVNSAVFNSVKTPFYILLAVFIMIVLLTAVFVVHEIKNDTPENRNQNPDLPPADDRP